MHKAVFILSMSGSRMKSPESRMPLLVIKTESFPGWRSNGITCPQCAKHAGDLANISYVSGGVPFFRNCFLDMLDLRNLQEQRGIFDLRQRVTGRRWILAAPLVVERMPCLLLHTTKAC